MTNRFSEATPKHLSDNTIDELQYAWEHPGTDAGVQVNGYYVNIYYEDFVTSVEVMEDLGPEGTSDPEYYEISNFEEMLDLVKSL